MVKPIRLYCVGIKACHCDVSVSDKRTQLACRLFLGLVEIMSVQYLCLSVFAALLLVQATAQLPQIRDELSEQYTYNVQLDNEGRYTMFYDYDTDLGILRIAVLVQTTGWVGLGISPNGQMPGSDVVMGWVDNNGRGFLQVTE